MANEEIASQVLDYWFAIEFLGQDSYDVCTEESKLVRALKTFKKADQSTKNKRRQISVFELVNSESDIYSQIVNQAKECDMTIWGNLTFYIGRVSRQACIEKLAQELGAKLEQEERNSEYIPILSFQCTTNGAYVEHSLSLSTVIWAISQVEGKQNGKLSDLLSSRAYSDTIEQLEREFFESDNFNEQEAIEEASVGALYRARKAIIVGDPKQVEPVVTDDLKLLKEAYSEPVFANYKNKSLSVQSCADIMNPFGTSYDNGTDYPDWVGCPLLVHRRCISPMYEISNRISYNGIMKQQTLPPSDGKVESFIYEKSQWINVTGVENGHGDHYVAEQGNVVCEMVNVSFQKAIKISKMQVDTKPSLYIITPFTTVVSGLRKAIGTYATRNKNSALGVSTSLDEWLYDNIGTVHKFQGKEANEVIFVLGCDESQKNRYAVKGFVNSNIVNVAATRAKYRFYMVGDQKVWGKNEYVNEAKSIMDRLLIEDAEENN